MQRVYMYLLAVFFAYPFTVSAQQAPITANASAEAAQFDFLLGEWQIEVHPKVSGLVAMIHGAPKLLGTWKAWRASGSASIDDEIRIVDASGNPLSLSRSRRSWDAINHQWTISGHDVTHDRASEATGRRQGDEMRLTGQSSDGDVKTLTRTRFYNIGPESFRMIQDRSTDNGQSWEEGSLTIDAKRTAATATP